MAFDLELHISGLCVFVPDPSGKKMHVLMVAPAGHGGHPAVRHYPRVFYDAVHDGSVKMRDAYWSAVPLEDMVLDLSDFSGRGGKGRQLEDIQGLVDIRDYIDKPLKNPAATDLPNLAARVTLPLADDIESPIPREDWQLEQDGSANKVVPKAAWKVMWTIKGVAKPDLNWQLKPFPRDRPRRPIPGLPLAPLHPFEADGRKVIELHISNAVRDESGPPSRGAPDPPASGFPMPHFNHFQDIYDNSVVAKPWPRLVYVGPSGPQRGTQYTCLSSGGK